LREKLSAMGDNLRGAGGQGRSTGPRHRRNHADPPRSWGMVRKSASGLLVERAAFWAILAGVRNCAGVTPICSRPTRPQGHAPHPALQSMSWYVLRALLVVPAHRVQKRCQFIFPSGVQKRCQFIFPSEDGPADGGLTRCSIFGLSVPSIPEPRVAGRSARNHAPTSTRLLFALHRPSLATACGVPPRSVPVRPTRETGLRADRHVPSHGKGNSTTDNPRGPRPASPGLGWPRCTAERPANEHPLE
jgi:hypothetical protein